MQLKHHLAPGSGEREARGRDGVLKKTFQSGLHRDLDGGDHSRGLARPRVLRFCGEKRRDPAFSP